MTHIPFLCYLIKAYLEHYSAWSVLITEMYTLTAVSKTSAGIILFYWLQHLNLIFKFLLLSEFYYFDLITFISKSFLIPLYHFWNIKFTIISRNFFAIAEMSLSNMLCLRLLFNVLSKKDSNTKCRLLNTYLTCYFQSFKELISK